jgi:hypothetical protein
LHVHEAWAGQEVLGRSVELNIHVDREDPGHQQQVLVENISQRNARDGTPSNPLTVFFCLEFEAFADGASFGTGQERIDPSKHRGVDAVHGERIHGLLQVGRRLGHSEYRVVKGTCFLVIKLG